MTISGWYQNGCVACRNGALSGHWPPPERIGTLKNRLAFVHRCSKCHSYWIFNIREAHVIQESEVSVVMDQMSMLNESQDDLSSPEPLIFDTSERNQVEAFHQFSIEGVNAGEIEEFQNWDTGSSWLNSKFTHVASGIKWVVYIADQAWPGEVKVLEKPGPNSPLKS